MKHLFSLLILLVAFGFAKGQEKPIVQFSGIIYNVDSNTVVPYVSITNKSDKNKVVSANHKGYFSFVAHQGDSVVFSAVGYKRETLVIPTNLTDKKYSALVKMKSQVINLPAVQILPWASIDDFTRDFMALKYADDDLEIARKNLSRNSLMAISRSLPRDGGEMNTQDFKTMHYNLSNKNINQRGANPLLNPFAWSAFIQQIMNGDKSRANTN